jgi:hypothetical protein
VDRSADPTPASATLQAANDTASLIDYLNDTPSFPWKQLIGQRGFRRLSLQTGMCTSLIGLVRPSF